MRTRIITAIVVLGAAVIAAGASADFRRVNDPRGDTLCDHGPCSASAKRNGDIVRATAGHEDGKLRHTIRVVGKFQFAILEINTDSDGDCEFFLEAHRGRRSGHVRECNSPRPRHGRTRMDFHRHSVKIVFSERSIGNPQSYGWRAFAFGGTRPLPGTATSFDHVPAQSRYIRHRLGDSGVAAAGVMALGAQTAAAVVKYDTTLTLTKDGGPNYHGEVWSDRDLNPVYHPATAVRRCMKGRRVVLFKLRPGPDRRLGADRSRFHWGGRTGYPFGDWWLGRSRGVDRDYGARVRAEVKPKVRDRYVCRADHAAFEAWPQVVPNT
jgi:hypothetical protein